MKPAGLLASIATALIACTPQSAPAPAPRAASEPTAAEERSSGPIRSPTDIPLADPLTTGVAAAYGPIAVWNTPKLGPYDRVTPAWNRAHQTLVMPILKGARDQFGGGWYKVQLPRRPNGTTAWVKASHVFTVPLPHRIEIDLSERKLVHYKNDKVVHRFTVGIGQDRYPTPIGTFYVWAKVPQVDPSGPYGAYALGLSGFSPVLSDWPGGGRAAVHGTADPTDKGKKVSHGCIRVFNEDIRKLRVVPMGTPVIIRR